MSQRLQVLLPERELREIRKVASRAQTTVADWVRKALRAAMREEAPATSDKKLASIRSAARHAFPTADIDRMLAEIERGYGETE